MPETPYCPLLSINKDVPVLCQEELCMWYIKQLKLCSITVLAYSNALNLQAPGKGPVTSQQSIQKPQSQAKEQQVKPGLTKEPKKEEGKAGNPFVLDDLD